MINIFILFTVIDIEHMFIGFIQNMVIFIKHHAILNIALARMGVGCEGCFDQSQCHSDVIPIGKLGV